MRARRGRTRPKRAQSQCRLPHRIRCGKIVGEARRRPAAGPTPKPSRSSRRAGGRRRDRLRDARALRPCQRTRPGLRRPLVQAKPARVVIALKDPDPRTAGQGHPPASRRRDRGDARRRARSRASARSPAGSPGSSSVVRALRSSSRCRSTARSRCLRANSKWITGEDARPTSIWSARTAT